MARTANAVGCKPNWCTNVCYLCIGYMFIGGIGYLSMFPSIIGMWNLGPKIVSSTIASLGPPLMTLDYQEKLPSDRISFPPGVAYPTFSGSDKSSPAKKAFDINSLSKTQVATFKAAFDQLDLDKTGFITIKQFSKYIAIDQTLETEAERKAFIAKVDKDSDGKVTFNEFAKWMSAEPAA